MLVASIIESRGFLPASGKHIYPSCHASIYNSSSVTAITGSRTTPEVSTITNVGSQRRQHFQLLSAALESLYSFSTSNPFTHPLFAAPVSSKIYLLHFICHNCDDAAMELVFNLLISQVHTVFLTNRNTSMFKQVTVFIQRLSALKGIHLMTSQYF